MTNWNGKCDSKDLNASPLRTTTETTNNKTVKLVEVENDVSCE